MPLSLMLCWILRVVSLQVAIAAKCFPKPPQLAPQGSTVRILTHGWKSHKLVSSVAAILLREQMGFDVEHVRYDSVADDYALLANGNVDANFEIWPMEKFYVDERKAAEATDGGSAIRGCGAHSVESFSGLFVPKYVTDAHPADKFYRHLSTDDAQHLYSQAAFAEGEKESDPSDLCATKAFNCTDHIWYPPYCEANTCRAQVLKGPLQYDVGMVEQLIANNELNISVAYMTEKAKKQAVWDAYAARQHVLFYNYVPSEGILGLKTNLFERVRFRPGNRECLTKNSGDPTGALDCELESYYLRKVVSRGLADIPDALHFAQALDLSQSDYDGLFRQYELSHSDSDLAACRWLHSVGQERWDGWVQHTKYTPFKLTGEGCWVSVYIQAAILIVSLLFQVGLPKLLARLGRHCVSGGIKLERSGNEDVMESGEIDTVKKLSPRLDGLGVNPCMVLMSALGWASVEIPMAILKGDMTFLSFKRSERNFLLREGEIPPLCRQGLRFHPNHNKMKLLQFIITSSMPKSIWAAVNFSLLAGVIGSMAHLVHKNLASNLNINPDGLANFERSADSLLYLVGNFSFLPVLMLGFFISKEADRWVSFMNCAYLAWARSQDLCLTLGGAFAGVNDPKLAATQRVVLFKFYRLINAAHYLKFFGHDPRLGSDKQAAIEDMVEVNLLTKEEISGELQNIASNHMSELILSWVVQLWHEQVDLGVLRPHGTDNFMRTVQEWRASYIHVEKSPTLLMAMLDAVIHILLLFLVAGHPMRMLQEDTCMQPWSMITTFFTFICYLGMMNVMRTLQLSPYSPHGDCFNVDWLLCDVEQSIFFYLRSAFSKSIATTESSPPHADEDRKPCLLSVACPLEGCDKDLFSAYSKSIATTESSPPHADNEDRKPYLISVACPPEGCDKDLLSL